ncbi:hypothetical protein [Pyxidicoccus xibeiensis]|uniref:hypothetical protein n=1 Tax=Pyxidicoccus xibeiensis TaxID=2906759 RepID=UPI0020A705AD|nr:hypothetical protein [Pyxidicoccus xibeiensis]MCP3139946.1 hypothetical protein [Pyxidicoccus xibeiensis]
MPSREGTRVNIGRKLWVYWRKRPYGRKLASQVADALGQLHYDHVDYCGTGFFHRARGYIYDHVYDGYPVFETPGGSKEAIAVFPDRASFVDWLSEQSDWSLSGRDQDNPWYFDNQRITRARLKGLLAGQNPRV